MLTILIHHYIVSGRWFDWNQIMHHEVAFIGLLGFIIGLVLGLTLGRIK